MQQRGYANSGVFAHSGVSFEDIVQNNACGGVAAVERYFVARRRMLVREMAQITARNEDAAHHARVLDAIDRALALLASLGEPAKDGQAQ